jgi:hypothetical protein
MDSKGYDILSYPLVYINREVSYLLEPYVQLNTVSSYILVTHSLTILDLPLSLPPPSQEYPHLGVPTLGTRQNTTVTSSPPLQHIHEPHFLAPRNRPPCKQEDVRLLHTFLPRDRASTLESPLPLLHTERVHASRQMRHCAHQQLILRAYLLWRRNMRQRMLFPLLTFC